MIDIHHPSPRMRYIAIALLALTIFLLFYLGSMPIAVGLFKEPWDKLAHFVAYATIATLLCLGIAPHKMPLPIVLITSAIGFIDEWHQMALPGRSVDLGDFLTDTAAAIFAITAYSVFSAYQARLVRSTPHNCISTKETPPCAE
jgi:VanZ family protein